MNYESDWESFSTKVHRKYLQRMQDLIGEGNFEKYQALLDDIHERKNTHLKSSPLFKWAFL